jgi:hypothetical protein
MKLTHYEQEMLDGRHGKAKAYAMERLVEFGTAVEAEEMVEVTMVHYISPLLCDRDDPDRGGYELGESDLALPFVEFGEKVADHATCTTEPYLCQVDKFDEPGYPWNCSGKRLPTPIFDGRMKGYEFANRAGWVRAESCTIPMHTNIPKFGEYCACAESSAATYINTMIGARTNRENPWTVQFAAYAGVLPKYGTMLDENRRAKVVLELDSDVRDGMSDPADWAALGAAMAIKSGNRVPAVLNMPRTISTTAAKAITACASPGMNDPMLHLIGLSPESPTLEAAFGGTVPRGVERYPVTMADIRQVYRDLNTATSDDVQVVHLGCPHLNYDEVRQIARLIEGRRVKDGVHLWVQTDSVTYQLAQQHGEAAIIERAGGKIYHQTCLGMLMISGWDEKANFATNSFKEVKLFSALTGGWMFGTVPDLIDAAVTGRFVSRRW